jgi:hypothetical protein
MYIMIKVLIFFILYILLISITMPKPAVEGFNTYFRQTIRPSVRSFKEFSRNIVEYPKQTLMKIGRRFGIY